MAAQPVERQHAGTHVVILAEDLHPLVAVHQAAAQRLRGLEAGDKDGAAWVFDVVLQVVENAPRLGHAAGADDDRRLAQEVQLLRLLRRAGIAHHGEAERIAVAVGDEDFGDLGVIRLGMGAEDRRGIDGQRAVDVDLKVGRQVAPLDQVVETVDQLLCTADGEGGHDDLAPLLHRLADDLFQLVVGVLIIGVLAVAVGAFHDQHVGPVEKHGVIENGPVGAAQITGEDDARRLPRARVVHVEHDQGRPQHVPGVVEGQGDARRDLIGALVADADELLQAGQGVGHGVDRLQRRQVVAAALLVQIGHVRLLNLGAITQHDAAQVARGRGGDDVAGEAIADEAGDVAAVVDVGVGEDERVHSAGVEG